MPLTSPHQKALFLSYLTVGYNLLEGALSLLAGCLAGSIALVAFGLDSFVESFSGGIMIWRFHGHADMTSAQAERREKLAIKMVGWTFFALAAYVLYESLQKLALQEAPAPSLLGIFIALASLIFMPLLFALKLRTSADLGSRSLRAERQAEPGLRLPVPGPARGLRAKLPGGLWQADPIIGLIIAPGPGAGRL